MCRLAILASVLLLLPSCSADDETGSPDGDADADGDTDSDGDADGDTGGDADADADTDADADGDADLDPACGCDGESEREQRARAQCSCFVQSYIAPERVDAFAGCVSTLCEDHMAGCTLVTATSAAPSAVGVDAVGQCDHMYWCASGLVPPDDDTCTSGDRCAPGFVDCNILPAHRDELLTDLLECYGLQDCAEQEACRTALFASCT